MTTLDAPWDPPNERKEREGPTEERDEEGATIGGGPFLPDLEEPALEDATFLPLNGEEKFPSSPGEAALRLGEELRHREGRKGGSSSADESSADAVRFFFLEAVAFLPRAGGSRSLRADVGVRLSFEEDATAEEGEGAGWEEEVSRLKGAGARLTTAGAAGDEGDHFRAFFLLKRGGDEDLLIEISTMTSVSIEEGWLPSSSSWTSPSFLSSTLLTLPLPPAEALAFFFAAPP